MSHQIVEERTYTIPFYPKLNSIPRTKRAQRAVKMVRDFVMKHMKVEDVWISQDVNEEIFKRGMQKPPRKITIRAEKADDDVVAIYLSGIRPEDYFKSDGVPVATRPSEEEIDLEEEDFVEEEE
ncbi:MAG: 50S ribosomal protein L31e [Candidatus Kariarchaeaceae archaeon]|jgi:large subunit ribosomal protein L31e